MSSWRRTHPNTVGWLLACVLIAVSGGLGQILAAVIH